MREILDEPIRNERNLKVQPIIRWVGVARIYFIGWILFYFYNIIPFFYGDATPVISKKHYILTTIYLILYLFGLLYNSTQAYKELTLNHIAYDKSILRIVSIIICSILILNFGWTMFDRINFGISTEWSDYSRKLLLPIAICVLIQDVKYGIGNRR